MLAGMAEKAYLLLLRNEHCMCMRRAAAAIAVDNTDVIVRVPSHLRGTWL
jgi:hypothetical protein